MVHYDFKYPNLLEIILLVALVLVAGAGIWLMSVAWNTQEAVGITLDSIQTAFSLLQLIFLGIIALILENIREHIRYR